VVADQRLADGQLLGQVGDAELLAGQQLHDPPAQRVAQRSGQLDRQRLSAGERSRFHRGRRHPDQYRLIAMPRQAAR
jgi:hypothetical protein